MNFSAILMQWYALNKRELPWRYTNNPYFIWLSEIILQQTKVDQGLPYYLKFTLAFPLVNDLANAKEDMVLKLWQGLGYYSRARNLHSSAKYIVKNYNGEFPSEYINILNLKGVGPYTAAAISSFSFGLPYAVVDGNVIRVLSRIFGIEIPFDSALGKKKYQQFAQDLLDKQSPAENNQAIMEFGALQCTSKSPKCSDCPFASDCVALSTNSISRLPVKSKKVKIKERFLNYLLIKKKNSVILGKRSEGIWKGLYEFPFIEYSTRKSEKSIVASSEWNNFFKNSSYMIESSSHEFAHRLSHQYIYARFWTVIVEEFELKKYSFVRNSQLNNYPVSRLTDKFLKEYNII